MASSDPLLQPYQLKHLTLRNRIMSTSHEPAYSEDGMPKERYRLYHVEKAKGGVALTMTAGSAVIAEDSPQAFGNLHAYKDEVVPWLCELADDCHEHGAAVMIQLTHLGRRTNWNHSDWLPVLSRPRRCVNRPTGRFRRRCRRLGHRAHHQGLRVGCRAHEGGRPRRFRVRVLRPPDGRFLVARSPIKRDG